MSGSAPHDDVALFRRLDELGIVYRNHRHPPVFTVAESRSLRGLLPGAHVKNLFLRDKKRTVWLVTALEGRQVDLKALRRRLGASGSLSFCGPELLMQLLGVVPGAVTPFGILNDRDGLVRVVLDTGILRHEAVNAHPLRNDSTTAVRPADLIAFLEAERHPPLLLDMEDLG